MTYPDEMLEEAIGKLASRGVGRLPVVERRDPAHLVGYLGRTGPPDAWLRRVDEEEKRETGRRGRGAETRCRDVRRALSATPLRASAAP